MAEVSEKVKTLADQVVGLTLKEAVEFSAYIKEAYGIEPAAGGVAVMAGARRRRGGGSAGGREDDV